MIFLTLKTNFLAIKSIKTEQKEDLPAEDAIGFFEDDEDETIALTGDELDNILNTADVTEESGTVSEAPEDDLLADLDIDEAEPEEPFASEEITDSDVEALLNDEPEETGDFIQDDTEQLLSGFNNDSESEPIVEELTIDQEPVVEDELELEDFSIDEEPAAEDELVLEDISIDEEPAAEGRTRTRGYLD